MSEQAELRESLTSARAASMELLKDNMTQLQLLENDIYTVDCKLDKLVDENTRFTQVFYKNFTVWLTILQNGSTIHFAMQAYLISSVIVT